MNNLDHVLILASIIFIIGIWGIFLNRQNLILILISIELILLAINLNFVVFSIILDDIVGQVFTIFVLTVAAAESAIGLAILVAFYRLRGSIGIKDLSNLKNPNHYDGGVVSFETTEYPHKA